MLNNNNQSGKIIDGAGYPRWIMWLIPPDREPIATEVLVEGRIKNNFNKTDLKSF